MLLQFCLFVSHALVPSCRKANKLVVKLFSLAVDITMIFWRQLSWQYLGIGTKQIYSYTGALTGSHNDRSTSTSLQLLQTFVKPVSRTIKHVPKTHECEISMGDCFYCDIETRWLLKLIRCHCVIFIYMIISHVAVKHDIG